MWQNIALCYLNHFLQLCHHNHYDDHDCFALRPTEVQGASVALLLVNATLRHQPCHHLHHYHHHPPHHNHHHHPCHARLFNFLPHCIVAMQKHSMWLKIFQEWETNSKILKIGFHGNLRSFKSGSGCRCFLVFVAIFTVLCNSASFSYFSTDILPT